MSAPSDVPTSNSAPPTLTWWSVLHAPKMATGLAPLLIATLGLVATALGTAGLNSLVGPSEAVVDPANILGESWLSGLGLERRGATLSPLDRFDFAIDERATRMTVVEPYLSVLGPLRRLAGERLGWVGSFRELVHGIWRLLAWGVVGTAIARSVAVRVSRGSHAPIWTSLRFAGKRSLTAIATPLAPMGLALALGLPGFLLGLIGRIPSVGAPVAQFFGFIPMILGVASAAILLGAAMGWPLMIGAIAVESADGFESISRSYSYVNQRTPAFLGLALLAFATAEVGLFVARLFASMVWALGLRGFELGQGAAGGLEAWAPAASLFLFAWVHSLFWTSTVLIYLWLRKSVDGADVDLIAPDDEPAEPPTFADTPPAVPTAEAQG